LRDLTGDYYEFDERNYCLVGRRTRRTYSLGDKVNIRVEHANLDRRQLDFSIVEEDDMFTSRNVPEEPEFIFGFENKSKKAKRDKKSGGKRR
jgi:ribonuclease R